MTNIELDFILMMIENTRSGEYRSLMSSLNSGTFDDDLKLAFNRARRLRRWFERNEPSSSTREIELQQAKKGYDHFYLTDVKKDDRFISATSTEARLSRAYRIVDDAKQEIESYVEAVKQRLDGHATTGPGNEIASVP